MAGEWIRCGNTPYYRSGNGFGWSFVDPFNWRWISTHGEDRPSLEDKQIVAVFRQAPSYDWEMLKKGVDSVADSDEHKKKILQLTHEWANDLSQAKKLRASPKELRQLFEEAPEDARAAVLTGVKGLFDGYAREEMQHFSNEPGVKYGTIIAIPGTDVTRDVIRDIESDYVDLKDTILAPTSEEGFERVLAELEIFEC